MTNIIRRMVAVGFVASAVMVLAGCGGGGSHNEDFGLDPNGHGGKSITRTLENDSDFYVTVDLELNDRDYLDRITIRPGDYSTIRVDNLYIDEFVAYHATFDNGDTTSGRFSEDGRTIFTHGDSRVAGKHIIATDIDGKSAVKEGGVVKAIDARKPASK